MQRDVVNKVKRAHHSSADVIIGKKGITSEVLKEIDFRLDRQEIVKVKMLKTAVGSGEERRIAAKEVARAVKAKLMGVRGRTFVLYRPRKNSVFNSRRGR